MDELYRTLTAWRGSAGRGIGRITTWHGAPGHALRRRVELARRTADRPDQVDQDGMTA